MRFERSDNKKLKHLTCLREEVDKSEHLRPDMRLR